MTPKNKSASVIVVQVRSAALIYMPQRLDTSHRGQTLGYRVLSNFLFEMKTVSS